MKTIAWMLIFSLVITACSRTRTAESVSQDTPQIELSDADTSELAASEPVSETPADAAVSNAELAMEETPVPEGLSAAAPVIDEMSATPTVVSSEGEAEYIIQKNETLMMVAFKLYGDYGKWRELASRNASKVKNGTIPAGAKIRYTPSAQPFEWAPQGNPYLIRTGDTLGKISGSVYGTPKKWKSLWENNRPLIKDPNRIFAGFTLYWLGQEKVASYSASDRLEL